MDSVSDSKKKETGCCCGPYPIIDLSQAFINTKPRQRVECDGDGGGDDGGIARSQTQSQTRITSANTRDELKKACRQYGCFHVNICVSPDVNSRNTSTSIITSTDGGTWNDSNSSDLGILSDENKVKQQIESLFEEDFLSSCCRVREDSNCGDGSAPMVSYFHSSENQNDNCDALEAVYRGKSAESGSSEKSSLEPKQSWEFFRCPPEKQHFQSTKERDGDDNNDNTVRAPRQSRLQILQSFVSALHEVADILCSEDLLDLPKNKFICSSNPNNANANKDANKNTDISMLRVFRYDALSTEKEQYSNLGSSSHTDWGSMTVVWQDSKGGLQIYCHKHQCWNDVKVDERNMSQSDSKSETKSESNFNSSGETQIVRLFIHVGDYLSLAMNSVSVLALNGNEIGKENGEKDGSGCREEDANANVHHQNVIWPSPTHRVLCPLRIDDKTCGTGAGTSTSNHADNSRCSLVYFVYPPNGIKMIDSISSLHGKDTDHYQGNSKFTMQGTMVDVGHSKQQFPFSRYMLLNNQSVASTNTCSEKEDTNIIIDPDKAALGTFNKILHRPFHEVIEEKWNQVQRS